MSLRERHTLKNNMDIQRNLAIILIPALILTIVWVASSVYHSWVNSTIDIPLEHTIKPIKSSFDMESIEQVKSRTRVEPLTDESVIPTELINDEDSSPSAELEEEVATDSAEIEEEL